MRAIVPVVVLCLVSISALNCSLRGQSAHASRFVGEWTFQDSTGSVPPYDLVTKVQYDGGRLTFDTTWGGPPNAPQGLTFIGVVTPHISLDLSGREAGSQVGPFVIRHTSEWKNEELVTRWSTSEYMGSSYSGTWKRSVAKDGSTMTLDIYALSSIGSVSRARIVFRRK